MISFQNLLPLLLCCHLSIADQSLQCGDWDIYKDEKCVKVFDNKELQTYDDSKNTCHQNEGSSLVVIRSQEEQDYVISLLVNVHKAVNNVWIGASLEGKLLKWMDNTTVNYTNWANNNPIDQNGYDCAQMEIIEPYHGKWFNVPCNQKNLIVCQKSQNWLFSYLQKTVMDLRESVEIITKQLENTKIDFQNELMRKTTESTPPGTIAYFSNISAPIGWLKANGQSVSRTRYVNLFATIGTTYDSGDGSTTFTLPDLRGEFIRSWSDGRDVDTDRSIGSFQWGSSIPYAGYVDGTPYISSATGNLQIRAFAGKTFDGDYKWDLSPGQTRYGMTFNGLNGRFDVLYLDTTKTGNITNWSLLQGTRPRNIALLACIKY